MLGFGQLTDFQRPHFPASGGRFELSFLRGRPAEFRRVVRRPEMSPSHRCGAPRASHKRRGRPGGDLARAAVTQQSLPRSHPAAKKTAHSRDAVSGRATRRPCLARRGHGAARSPAASGFCRSWESETSAVPHTISGRPTGGTHPLDPDKAIAHIAEAAAIEVAGELLARGFAEARAEGPNVIARQGKITWRIINRVRHEPGIRARVHEQFAALVVANLVNRLPSREHQPLFRPDPSKS